MNPSASRLMSLALVLVAIISLIPAGRAYVYIIPGRSDQKGHCFDGELKIVVPVNEERQRMGRCESMTCSRDFSLSVAGCGLIAAGPGFIVTPTDYSKPYPECCPTLVPSP